MRPSSAGDVGHVGAAHERDHMVLAQRGERDVPHHDHLVVVGGEGHRQVLGRVLVDAGEELDVHLGHPARRLEQAVAVGVLTDGRQDLGDGLLDSIDVDAHGRVSAPLWFRRRHG